MSLPLPALITPRLELTTASEGDAAALFELEYRCAASRDAARFLVRPPPKDVAEVRARLARDPATFSEEASVFSWLIRLPGEPTVIGYAAFVRWDHHHRKSEVAYVVDPAHWGHGYAAEATARILAFAWDGLGLHRAEAHVDPRNRASVRTAEKLGFTLEGTLRESFLMRGRFCDTAVYARIAPTTTA